MKDSKLGKMKWPGTYKLDSNKVMAAEIEKILTKIKQQRRDELTRDETIFQQHAKHIASYK